MDKDWKLGDYEPLVWTIIHTAEPVTYLVDGFVEKNNDDLPALLKDICRSSKRKIVQ